SVCDFPGRPRSKSILGRRPPAVISPLLRHALGRRVRRQGEPGVARLLPHRDGRRGEIRVGEVADGNGDGSRKAFALPVDGGAARRTEMKGQRVATVGCPQPRRRLTGEGDLLAAEARLVADRGASAALALQAVAHGDARWFALDRKVKLPATAGGASGGHGPAPWLSIWRSVGWTSKRCTWAAESYDQLMSASGTEQRSFGLRGRR